LTEEISKYHIELTKTDDFTRKAEIKERISLFTTLHGIIDKRIDEVRSVEREYKKLIWKILEGADKEELEKFKKKQEEAEKEFQKKRVGSILNCDI